MSNYRLLITIKEFFEVLSLKRCLQFSFCIFISIISALLELVNIALMAPLINGITQKEITNALLINLLKFNPFFSESSLILQLSLLLIFTLLAAMIIRFFTVFITFKLSAVICSDLGNAIFQKAMKMPYLWHIKTNSSLILGYLTVEIDNIQLYLRGLLKLIVNAMLVIIISSYLIYSYPIRTSFILSLVIFGYWIIFSFLKSSFAKDGKQLSQSFQETIQISEETNIAYAPKAKNTD